MKRKLERDNVTFISMFDVYLTNIDNRQRQYAIHELEKLERVFRDSGQLAAADTTRSFRAKIVGDVFERLFEIQDEMESV
jgi:hypothetical protein